VRGSRRFPARSRSSFTRHRRCNKVSCISARRHARQKYISQIPPGLVSCLSFRLDTVPVGFQKLLTSLPRWRTIFQRVRDLQRKKRCFNALSRYFNAKLARLRELRAALLNGLARAGYISRIILYYKSKFSAFIPANVLNVAFWRDLFLHAALYQVHAKVLFLMRYLLLGSFP